MQLSLQLYSMRNESEQDAVLVELNRLGLRQVEGWGGQFGEPASLVAALGAAGLTMPSAHIGFDQLVDTATTIEIARQVGIQVVYCPAPPTWDFDEQGWREFAAQLDPIGSALRAAGIRFGYHNHHVEFAVGADGTCPMDILLAGVPSMEWEMDVAWVVKGGQDPIRWMRAHGDRITALHVKDIAEPGEAVDEDGWADVGHGNLDWPSLLATARSDTAASLFVLEHDKPSDALRFARRSIASVNEWLAA